MLTGQPPFSGATPTAVLMKRLTGPPTSVMKLRAEIPQGLSDVIEGCLAQDPQDRFQTAGDVARALGGATPVSAGHPTAEIVFKMRRARRRWTLFASLGAVALAAAAVAVVVLSGGSAPAAPVVPAGMIAIPGGEYLVGDDRPSASSWPMHGVAVDTFAIDSTEVTVGQYKVFAAARGKSLPWDNEPDNRLPVTGVNFPNAVEYCGWRATGGRLPTELEWEAAARGPQGFRYPWGNVWDANAANTAAQNQNRPIPVGSLRSGATSTGVMDMIGNVWEWTSSPMRAYPGGRPLPDSLSQYLVIRGGAFNSSDAIATASYRGYLPPTAANSRAQYGATGFRCVVPLRGAAPSE
jgi:formylglycine-generating enzyme required for sulfatase activity